MALWDLFDQVYVVSLRSSYDRRAHIRSHFRAIGLDTYVFHDASDGNSPEVQRLYAENRVAQFPPCFRCGKVDCGKPDCNNVLIPAQVAVFATYLNLWQKLATTNVRALICEDDVVFHPWWMSVLEELQRRIGTGDLIFNASEPALLRLGWALSQEHRADVRFEINDTIKMSNPCHAITSAYASALLAEFDGVNHTADVFQHSFAKVSDVHARTVFPPIAYELSWSVGALESLIHPKDIRARYLETHGRQSEAETYRIQVARHVTQVSHRKPS